MIEEVEVDHQPVERASQVSSLGAVQKVAAAAIRRRPGRRITKGQEQTAAVLLQPSERNGPVDWSRDLDPADGSQCRQLVPPGRDDVQGSHVRSEKR